MQYFLEYVPNPDMVRVNVLALPGVTTLTARKPEDIPVRNPPIAYDWVFRGILRIKGVEKIFVVQLSGVFLVQLTKSHSVEWGTVLSKFHRLMKRELMYWEECRPAVHLR